MGCVIIWEWARNEAWMTKQERHTGFWQGNRQKNKMENQTRNAKVITASACILRFVGSSVCVQVPLFALHGSLLLAKCRGDSLLELVIAAIVLQQQNKTKRVAIFKILSLRGFRFKMTSS
jgi:hypothetical protein